MIAEALKLEIEDHARRVRRDNPLVRGAGAGCVPPDAVGRYLVSLRHLIGHTPTCLIRARARAVAGGMHDLADHFAHKIREEQGHDVWAERDLEVLHDTFDFGASFRPVRAIEDLVDYIRRIIDRDPRLYLAYILWTEYLTVLGGGTFAEDLVRHCGIPREALTCLLNHVELDSEHADEGLDVIDRLVTEPALLAELREVVLMSASLFDRACEEILGATPPAVQAGAA